MFLPVSRPCLNATLLASLLTMASAAEAATLDPCKILPASEATRIVGMSLKVQHSGTPVAPSCIYLSPRPVFGFGLLAFSSESSASAMLKSLTDRSNPTVAYRQKGTFILSAIAVNHDGSKLAALLDAAAKHL